MFLQWGRATGLLPPTIGEDEVSTPQTFASVRETRAQLLRLLLPLSRSIEPADSDLTSFNNRLMLVNANLRLVPDGKAYRLACNSGGSSEQILSSVIRSTADLLLAGRLDRIKQCPECGWLFYDTSHNHRRRWCDMSVCGNRAKARRHYQRIRKKQTLPLTG